MKIIIEQDDPEGPVTFDSVYELPPATVKVFLADGHTISFRAQPKSVLDMSGPTDLELDHGRFADGVAGRLRRKDTGTFTITFDRVENVVFDTTTPERTGDDD